MHFKTNDWLNYPTHGLGIIQGTEEVQVEGILTKMYLVFYEKGKMLLRVPVTSPLILPATTKQEVPQLLAELRKRKLPGAKSWSRREQLYKNKIYSGNALQIAQVVKDTYSESDQSYSEFLVFDEAIDRLTREIAVGKNITLDKALSLIYAQLEKTKVAS